MQYSVDDFIQCLGQHQTATQALNHWCRSRRIPGGQALGAEILQDLVVDPATYTGPLQLQPGERLRHRRVLLNWGPTTASEADNWYFPDRIPVSLRDQLENTTIPFGQVVMSLGPVRKRLSQVAARPGQDDDRFILHVGAVLYTAQGTAIAEVQEHYRRDLLFKACGLQPEVP